MDKPEKSTKPKAKRGGRPRLNNDKREISMNFWVNPSEEKTIKEKIKRLGMRKANYLRECALNFDERQLPRLRLEVVYEIRKIGVNFNQLAHILNSKNVSGKKIDLEEMKEEVTSFINLLKTQLQSLKE